MRRTAIRDYGNPAAQTVQYCNRLFDYERQSREKGHTFDQGKEFRLQKEKPLLERLTGTKMADISLSKLATWDQNVIASCSGAM